MRGVIIDSQSNKAIQKQIDNLKTKKKQGGRGMVLVTIMVILMILVTALDIHLIRVMDDSGYTVSTIGTLLLYYISQFFILAAYFDWI